MWMRCRFKANYDDYRPIEFPPPGPYWCSGYGFEPDHSVIIAYFPESDDIENDVRKYWPEAEDIDISDREEITFTDRFPKPDWWNK